MRPTPQERFKPGADPDEVREYERLLAERFATDPSGPKTAGQLLNEREREARLAELAVRLLR